MEKLEEGVAKLLSSHATLGLYVYHGQEVLVAWSALRHEVGELCLLWDAGTIEVVGTHLESVSMSQVYVLFIFAIHVGTTFRGFQIDVCHLGVVAHGFPEHVALVVTEVDAMYVLASILALYLCMDAERHNSC